MANNSRQIFLDANQKIIDYFHVLQRVLDIVEKLSQRKEKSFSELKKRVVNFGFQKNPNFFTKWIKRKPIQTRREEFFDSLQELCSQIILLQNRQLQLLASDVSFSQEENNIIQRIQHVSLFRNLNEEEKNLLTSLVYSFKSYILDLHEKFSDLSKTISANYEILRKIIILSNESKTRQFVKEEWNNLISDLHFDKESEFIKSAKRVLEILRERAKELIEEFKKVEDYFDSIGKYFEEGEIETFKRELDQIIKREMYKLYAVTSYVRKQAQLRRTLPLKMLIAVHLTDYFPENGIIKTKGQVKTNIYGIEVTFPRETIHFSLNGPVGSHMMGNWDVRKFAVLIPVPAIIDRIVNIAPQDAFVIGELKLSRESEIIGKANDMSGQKFGHAKPVFIDDSENLKEAVITRIKEKGYIPMRIGAWSWSGPLSQEDGAELREFFNTDIVGTADWNRSFYELGKKLGKDTRPHGQIFGQIEDKTLPIIRAMANAMKTKPSDGECREQINETDEIIEQLSKLEGWFNSSSESQEAYKRMRNEYLKIRKFFEDNLKHGKK